MPSIIEEHNRLDLDSANLAAERLQSLFNAANGELPALPPDTGLGSPHLIDSLDETPLHEIGPSTDSVDVIAVDGGSSVLARGGNIEVAAWRAGMVQFEGRKWVAESCPPPEVLAYNRLSIKEVLEEYAVDTAMEYSANQPPLRPVDELRWLAEWRLISTIVDNAEKESLLLIDGSLRANTAFSIDFQRDILRRASERAVHIAAVTKQSSLSLGGGLPLDLNNSSDKNTEAVDYWYRQLNRPLNDKSGWLGNIYLARLHPGAEKSYRIDINRYDEKNTDKIFSMMTALSDDVEFCGYPYPLASAHRLARIDGIFRRELIESVGRALERREFPPQIWDFLTGDIHDKLNADIQALAQDHFYG